MTDKSGPRPGARACRPRCTGGARIAAGTGPRWADGACGGGARGRDPSTIYRRWGDLSQLLADVAVEQLQPEQAPPDTGSFYGDLLAGWNSTSTKCPRCPGAPCCATCWARRATKGPASATASRASRSRRSASAPSAGRAGRRGGADHHARGGAAHVWRAVRQPAPSAARMLALVREVEAAARRRGVNPRAVIRAKLENVHFHFEIPCQIARPIPPARPAPGAGRASSTWNRRWTGPWTCSVSAATTAPPLAIWRAAPSWRRAACTRRSGQARVVPAALDHRARRVEGMARAIGAGGTGRERLRRLLAFYAESSQGRQGRQGCRWSRARRSCRSSTRTWPNA